MKTIGYISNVTSYTLIESGVTQTNAWLLGQATYYGGVFGLSFYRHYATSIELADNNWYQFSIAAYTAAIEMARYSSPN